jgi:hypothetical protein
MMKCPRCKKDVLSWITSFFNTQDICIPCSEIEQKHPEFEAAKARECEEVRKGNYNYEGVGLPEDL